MRLDCAVKKKKKAAAHLVHRENWLLTVFHLWRRSDLEGHSSITTAVFTSCFTQSSWCGGGGGALLLNINFNVRLFARLLIYFFCPFNDSSLHRSVITWHTVHHTPFLLQRKTPLSLAHRHRRRFNFSRDWPADMCGCVGFGKKKFHQCSFFPQSTSRPSPHLGILLLFPPSSSSSHFPHYPHRTQCRSFSTLCCFDFSWEQNNDAGLLLSSRTPCQQNQIY